MASDASIFVRIDSSVKKDAETILRQLGVTPSSLITMLYHNVILTGGIPFDVRLPVREPIAIGNMSDEEILKIVRKGQDDVKAGRVYTLEEAEKLIKDKYGF
jgi:addiction module RelB/DinJ family antitoxin